MISGRHSPQLWVKQACLRSKTCMPRRNIRRDSRPTIKLGLVFLISCLGFLLAPVTTFAQTKESPEVYMKNEAGSELKWKKNQIIYGISGSGLQKIRTPSFLAARYVSLLTGIDLVPWTSGHIDLYILASDNPAQEGPADGAVSTVAQGSEKELHEALRTNGFTSINVLSSNRDGEITAAAIVVSTAVEPFRFEANLLKEMIYSLGFYGGKETKGSVFSRQPSLPTRADEEIVKSRYGK